MSKTILITGASSGIGKATAQHFQANGWNVIATMRKPENEQELTKLDHVMVTKLDVLDLASIDSAVAAGIEKFGKIDVLLNNAGYGAYGPLESFPRENIVRQFNTNVIGLMDVTRAVLPHFRANQSGTIINVSSVGGRMTFPFGSLYHGTKWAVEGITEALSFELHALGIRVKLIEPGGVATDFGGRSFDLQNDESLEEYQENMGKLMATFQELMNTDSLSPASLVAESILQAATDESDRMRYIVGADAEQFLSTRASMTEDEFIASVRKQFLGA